MSSRGLLDVSRFIVPAHVLDPTLEVLAEAGRNGYEAFVVWGGVREDGSANFRFLTAHKPRQESYKTQAGLLVHIDEQALFEVNRTFNERGLVLAGQAHSHPTDAYHSDTDDLLPLVTLLGGLSVVIPDFAQGGRADLRRFAWFRLIGQGRWLPPGPETDIVIE